jgi:hypothetical protein
LLKLAQRGSWSPALDKATTMEDAMDIMLQSDIRFDGDEPNKNLLQSEEDASDEEREKDLNKNE